MKRILGIGLFLVIVNLSVTGCGAANFAFQAGMLATQGTALLIQKLQEPPAAKNSVPKPTEKPVKQGTETGTTQ